MLDWGPQASLVRHGLLAKGICLNIEKTEVFEELLNDFIHRIQPTDPIEMRLVEQAAIAQFRYERKLSTEASMFVLEMDHQAPEITKKYERVDPPTRFSLAFKSLADDGHQLQLMLRYQNSMLRQRDSALKQIRDLRANFPVPAVNDERTTTNDERPLTTDERDLPNKPTSPAKSTEIVVNDET